VYFLPDTTDYDGNSIIIPGLKLGSRQVTSDDLKHSWATKNWS